MSANHRFAIPVLFVGAAAAAQAQSLVVVNQGKASISIIDPATLAVTTSIDQQQPGKMRAHEVAVSPDSKTAYLPVYGDSGVGLPGADGQKMLFVDTPSRKIIGSIPTGAEQSHMLALSSDGRRGYTANVGPGSVSMLDMKARKTLAVIPVAQGVQRIAIPADDKLVFTADTKLPRLAVIDSATQSVRTWIPLPGLGYGAAASNDGRWLLIGVRGVNQVAVIDLEAMNVVRTIAVGKGPQTTVIRPDDRMAYVTCAGDGAVSVIDAASWQVVGSIPTASGADGRAWAR